MALVASFVTTAVVFLPLIYLQGLARAFFGVQAFAIVTSLAVSLALSLTLTPILARRIGHGRPDRLRSPGLKLYLATLDRALAHPGLLMVITLVLLGGAAALLPVLPRELLPAGPSRALTVDYRLPGGLSRQEAERRIDSLDRTLEEASESALIHRTTIFRRSDPLRREVFGEREDQGEIELVFADADALGRARAKLEQRLARHPGVEIELAARRSVVAAAVEQSSRQLEIEMSAATAPRVEALAERVMGALRDSALGARVSRVEGGEAGRSGAHPGFALAWDAWRLAQLGADADALGTQVRAALGGFYAGRADIEGAEPEILLEATRPVDLHLLPVRPDQRLDDQTLAGASPGSNPRVVPLGALGSIQRSLEPAPLERQGGRPAARLRLAGLSGSRQSMAGLEATLEGIPLAVDERLRLGGQAHELRRSFTQLRLALALALVLVFLAVAALYESLALPLVVMTTVPVAAAGALGGLGLTGQSLNVMSFLGLILLTGIVVNNAIVLVHRIEQHFAAGRSPSAAIREAARGRYRPILMTTLTTLLGMVPLATVGGQGMEMRQALAITVCGGLITSLYAALLVVPVLHRALVRRGRR